ncbi:hypothetical protein [Pseudoxanthomonas suwonensis]|uniref:hypothetical protein n=1 Tax=Pseudoxanthomonas suwonensis TaxID=314722 RepID=UPI0004B1CBEF|nr:hypothetical protein [Pseudoxanthomonas suwonensis]
MNTKRRLCIALGLATTPVALPALAHVEEAPPPAPGTGLVELSDEEMGDMRGRYTVGDNKVAWFGVTMVSTWKTQAGAQLKSTMKVGVDVSRPQAPKVTFEPRVSITAANAPMPTPDGDRHVDAAGLANASGMVQSVQVAGDGNRAINVASINMRDGDVPTAPEPDPAASVLATTSVNGMTALATLDGNAARVLLQVDGHGAVEQWIGQSGMGQSIQLASDGQMASNWLELDLVRSSTQARASLGQNVAQAIALSRGIAVGY